MSEMNENYLEKINKKLSSSWYGEDGHEMMSVKFHYRTDILLKVNKFSYMGGDFVGRSIIEQNSREFRYRSMNTLFYFIGKQLSN